MLSQGGIRFRLKQRLQILESCFLYLGKPWHIIIWATFTNELYVINVFLFFA